MTEPTPRDTSATSDKRVECAMAFLQEAVYRSREAQASQAGLAPPKSSGGQCGLGERAAVVLDLSPRGESLFTELWPEGLAPGALEQVRAVMATWVERQDGLDRKRNHFMKDFRHRHGFDRSQYDEQQLADWETGLGAVNDEVRGKLRASAVELIDR